MEASTRVRRVDLGGGAALEVRTAEPGDVLGLVELYESLSAEDRYFRFLSGYHPDERFVAHELAPAPPGGAVLVAEVHTPDGPTLIVGEAEFTSLPNGDAELAIVVTRTWRGWLGTYLLDALIEQARNVGIANLEAEALVGNRPMIALARHRGAVVMDHEEWNVVRLLIPVEGRVPTWPGPHDRPRILVEGAARWPAEAAERAAGFQVVTCDGSRHRELGCPALEGEPCSLAADADAIVIQTGGKTAAQDAAQMLVAHARLHPGIPVFRVTGTEAPAEAEDAGRSHGEPGAE